MEHSNETEIEIIENVDNMCRSCLSSPLILINIGEIVHKNVPFQTICSEVFNTNIDINDELPKNLCEKCFTDIINFYDTKMTFTESQKILNTLCPALTAGKEVSLIRKPVMEVIIKDKCEEIDTSEPEEISDSSDKCEESNQEFEVPTSFLGKIFLCQGCNQSFTLLGIKKHNCKVCTICNKTFLSSYRQKIHMNYHNNTQPYVCEFCGCRHNSLTQLGKHRRKKHTGEKTYGCSICGERLPTMSSYRLHMEKSHNKIKEVDVVRKLCPLCGEGFNNTRKYLLHLESHDQGKTIEDIFLCEICSKQFTTLGSFRTHLHTHEKKYQCSFCQKCLCNSTSLKKHIATYHTKEKEYKCQHCDEVFKNGKSLQIHVKEHNKCEICSKIFQNQYKLHEHLRTHTGEKPFKCEYCKKGFACKGNYTAHVKWHSKVFQCEMCDEKFGNLRGVRRHKMRAHTL